MVSGGTWWRSPGWPIPAWVYTNAPYLSHSGYKLAEMLAPNVPPIEMRSPGARRPGLGYLGQDPVPLEGVALANSLLPPGIPPMTAVNTGPAPPPVPPAAAQLLFPSPAVGAIAPVHVTAPVQAPVPVPMPPTPTAPVTTTTAAAAPPVPVAIIFTDAGANQISSAVCGSVYSMTIPGWEGRTVYLLQTKNGAISFAGNFNIPMTNYASVCNQDEGSYQMQAFDAQAGHLIAQGSFTVLPAPAPGPTPAPAPAPQPTAASSLVSPTPAAPTPATSSTPIGTASPLPSASPITASGLWMEAANIPSAFPNLDTTQWMIFGAAVVLLTFLIPEPKGR